MGDSKLQKYVLKSLKDLAGKSAGEIAMSLLIIMKKLGDTEIIIGEIYDGKNIFDADLLEFCQSPSVKITSNGVYFLCFPRCKTWHPVHDPNAFNRVFHDFPGNNDAHNRVLDEFTVLLKNKVDQVAIITYFCNDTEEQIPIKFIN